MNPTHVHKHTTHYPGNKEKGPGGCIKFPSRQRYVPLVEIKKEMKQTSMRQERQHQLVLEPEKQHGAR